MSANIVQFPKSHAAPLKLPKLRQALKREIAEAAEKCHADELDACWAQIEQPLECSPKFLAWCSQLDQMSVRMDLPFMRHNDQREMFLRMFKNGAMSLRTD